MSSSGKLVIMAMFALAIIAVGFSTWYHYQNAHRCLAFWGRERASLIAQAPEIAVLELADNAEPTAAGSGDTPAEPPIVDAGRTYRVRASKPANTARGMSNIRRALVLDTTYDWQDTPDTARERRWQYGLTFRDADRDVTLLFDLPTGCVSTPEGATARLNPTAAVDLGEFFREQFPAAAK